MNYYKTYSMKSFICLMALVLTFSYSFANERSLINTQNSASYPQIKKVNDIVALTLSYEVDSFCEGKNGVSIPKVNDAGGTFSYTRESNGIGGLAFNTKSGKIDHIASDQGVYKITYKKGEDFATAIITVNSCN